MFSGADLKPYKNKEWLDEQINVLGKTQTQVAIECGVNRATVWYWLLSDEERKEVKNCARSRNKRYTSEYKEDRRVYRREYYLKNKNKALNYDKKYNNEHKEEIKVRKKNQNLNRKRKVFEKIGGCRCEICGDEDIRHLTIDHIDETGCLDAKEGFCGTKIYSFIVKDEYPKDKLSNLRVLCWNHNCGRNKRYLRLSPEQQTGKQRWRASLWKEAFSFFGPCRCGVSDLEFLTVSHIRNDGAERRRNGEPTAAYLLYYFKEAKWPESLKDDYCLECFNCNCSRGNRDE